MEAVWTQAGKQSQTETLDDDAAQYQEVGAWVCAQSGEVATEDARAQFPGVGNINSALSRAEKEGIIQRVRRGVYAAPSPAYVGDEVAGLTRVEALVPTNPGLREWLQVGVDAGHVSKQDAALLLWEAGE